MRQIAIAGAGRQNFALDSPVRSAGYSTRTWGGETPAARTSQDRGARPGAGAGPPGEGRSCCAPENQVLITNSSHLITPSLKKAAASEGEKSFSCQRTALNSMPVWSGLIPPTLKGAVLVLQREWCAESLLTTVCLL